MLPIIYSNMRTEPDLRQELAGGVLLLTFNRAQQRNTWTRGLQAAYFDALAAADLEPAVRVVVVTGAGTAFCVGADMSDSADGAPVDLSGGRPPTFPLMLRKPLIAAVNGGCAGIGLVQALCCDIRFVSETAKLTTAFSRRGLPAEHGLARLLTRVVGHGNAADLLISGRTIQGPEAVRMGLANRAVDGGQLLDATLAYARDIAENCAPNAIATIKRQLAATDRSALAEALRLSEAATARALASEDPIEGAQSFLERRAPRYAPLADETAMNAGDASSAT